MLRYFLAGALALAASQAHAADNDWRGIYVGAQVGHAWTNPETQMADDQGRASNFFNYDGDGVTGGVLAGWNGQYGAFVYGLEGDYSLADAEAQTKFATIEGSGNSGSFGFYHSPSDPMDFTTKIGWHSTLRARLGYAYGRYLLYGTGGVAFARVDSSYFTSDEGRSGETKTNFGYAAGGGVEGKLGPHMSWRLEYLYENYGQKEYDIYTVFDEPFFGMNFFQRTKLDMHTARVAVTYRF